MDILQLTSLLIVLAGLFGAVNYLLLKLPTAIGILVVSLIASMAILALDLLIPGFRIDDEVRSVVGNIAFSDALLEGMLGLLLFAGALHVKLSDLREQWRVVALMATIGVALSTVIIGTAFSWLTGMPFLIALVFGSLISPTDPVAVLGVLREAVVDLAVARFDHDIEFRAFEGDCLHHTLMNDLNDVGAAFADDAGDIGELPRRIVDFKPQA